MLDATQSAPAIREHFPITRYVVWVVWKGGTESLGDKPHTSLSDAAFDVLDHHETHESVAYCMVSDGMTGEDVTSQAHDILRKHLNERRMEWPVFLGGPTQDQIEAEARAEAEHVRQERFGWEMV